MGPVPSGVVGKPVEFESTSWCYQLFDQRMKLFSLNLLVDGSTAGSGNLEILVNGGHVTSYVRELGDQCFLASFVPHQATVHTIEVIYMVHFPRHS